MSPLSWMGDIFISAMFVLEALENVRCRPMFHNPLYLFGTTVEHDNQCFKYTSMWSMVLNLNYATHWEHICGGVIKQHQYFVLLQTDMHITLRHNTMWHNIYVLQSQHIMPMQRMHENVPQTIFSHWPTLYHIRHNWVIKVNTEITCYWILLSSHSIEQCLRVLLFCPIIASTIS